MRRRGLADWALAAEALVLLAGFRAALAMVPVRRIIGAIARGRADQGKGELNAIQTRLTVRQVQWAVMAAARHSIVEFVCFPQALAGYTMLRRRGVPSTLVYGVARSAEGDLLAHTWLTVGDETLLGGETAQEFIAIERWS
jgi:hypothetical protein